MEDWAYGFDKVLMIDVAEHIENDVFMEFLISAKSILNPDGELIIHTPNAGYYIERLKAREVILKQIPGHIAVRHAHHYKPMLATAGFNIKSIVYLPHYKNPMNMIDRKLMNPSDCRFFVSQPITYRGEPRPHENTLLICGITRQRHPFYCCP